MIRLQPISRDHRARLTRSVEVACLAMPRERPEEDQARAVVSEALGVPVEPYDDGSDSGMVDGVFTTPTGRLAALEVVSDVNEVRMRQWARIAKTNERLDIPGLKHGWWVQVRPHANINQLERRLCEVLGPMETSGLVHHSELVGQHTALDDLRLKLGVAGLHLEPSFEPGQIWLLQTGVVGTGSVEQRHFARWVGGLLSYSFTDVGPKLARHDADERHAFIWTSIESDGVSFPFLAGHFDLEPHENPPELPDGITHVWVADGGAAVVWFPDRGWWRTTFRLA